MDAQDGIAISGVHSSDVYPVSSRSSRFAADSASSAAVPSSYPVTSGSPYSAVPRRSIPPAGNSVVTARIPGRYCRTQRNRPSSSDATITT